MHIPSATTVTQAYAPALATAGLPCEHAAARRASNTTTGSTMTAFTPTAGPLKRAALRLLRPALHGAAVAAFVFAAASAAAEPADPPGAQIAAAHRTRPVAFEPNEGQADRRVDFIARAAGYTAYVTAQGAVFALQARGEAAVVRMDLVDADPARPPKASRPLPGTVHYARGDDPSRWLSLPTYAEVRYDDVYPGIGLVYHSRDGQLEYDFVVAPGADPGRIRLTFDGVQEVQVDADGSLVLSTATGTVRKPPPVVHQDVDGIRQSVAGGYVVDAQRRVGFALGPYDRSGTLVIDPVFVYSTYLGGSGDELDPLYGGEVGVAVDEAGNAYVTGTTMSADFPTTVGADRTRGGNQDAFVTKLSRTGAVLYSTYVGGPCDDVARAIAVHPATGEAYITGRVNDRCDTASPGVMVAKLNASGALAYFRRLGGTYADTSIGQTIAVDALGQAYVAGLAKASSGDFPVSATAFRRFPCDDYYEGDGFVAKINAAGTALLYSTYLCGTGHDSLNAIAVDPDGNAYLTGSTEARDFPIHNAYQPFHRGAGPADANAFVTKLNPTGSALVYSTYLGGSMSTVAQGIALDAQRQAHVTGHTHASDFPTTPGVVQQQAGNWNCEYWICSDAFVTKLDATGSGLVYSTYLYGEIDESANDIEVDAAGNAFVAGITTSLYFPTLDAVQHVNRGLADAFVAKLNPTATRLLYSTLLGGGKQPLSDSMTEGADGATSIALHAATGELVVAGYTASIDYPTADAWQPLSGGGICFGDGTPCGDAFVTRLTASGATTPAVQLSVSPTVVAAGGAMTVSWSGISAPTGWDELRLYRLGERSDDVDFGTWPASGTADGTRTVVLPVGLPRGTYELRLFSPVPDYTGLPSVVARSQPIYSGQ
jgi:hypothetical protein